MAVETKRQVTGGVALVKALEAQGVRYVFGIPGVHTLEIYDALYDSDQLSTVLPRHEQGAGFMADGYHRASGLPGVALTVTGPGVTNIATPLAQAFADSSRVLLIATNLERRYLGKLEGNLHEMTDQTAVVRPLVKWSYRVESADDIVPAVTEAFEHLYTGRPRPVYVEIPLDVLEEETTFEPLDPVKPQPVPPAPHLVSQAAELLRQANRVFILAGGGAATEETAPLLRELAEELGAPVCTSLTGKGAIPEDHPYATGAFGYRWSPDNPIASLMAASDLTIAIGTGLGIRTTAQGTMPLPTPLIHIDIDPDEIGKRYPAAVGIAADAALTLRALIEQVRAGARPADRWPVEEVQAVRRRVLEPVDERTERYLPYLRALREALPRDAIIVNDMTMMCYEGVRYLPVYEPRTYLFPRGFGTLGSSLPTAIGAKLARPDRAVVSLNGDGGFQFTMEELGALAHYRLPVTVVIFNDSTHTAVKVAMRRSHPGRYLDVDLVNPDFVKIAEAYRILAQQAGSPDQLAELLNHAVHGDGPMLIDVPIALERY
uniref:Thiamine pyrophosphate-binding protein n=1 Tax=Thermorudis peleae TaxID=1382356 RepID=A0A831T8A3_9BACT